MRPATGLRFTWQSNTLMKIEMRGSGCSPRPSSGGGTALTTAADAAVGRRDHQAVAHRRHPRRIAEEIGAPQASATVPSQPSGGHSQNRIRLDERERRR